MKLQVKKISVCFAMLEFIFIQFIHSDFDRTGSSPPKQNSQLTTTPYTPGSGQKRFNPFMKDTPTSQSNIDEHTNTTQLSDTTTIGQMQQQQQHQNDENKNIIMVDDDDDDNNQNILSTSNNDNNTHSYSQKLSQTPKTKYIEDDGSPAKIVHSDSDSNELTSSVHNEVPLPDWIVLNESVLIRPCNHSGVISFIGPTHFSVKVIFIELYLVLFNKKFNSSKKLFNVEWNMDWS